jgi:hypothetical protein
MKFSNRPHIFLKVLFVFILWAIFLTHLNSYICQAADTYIDTDVFSLDAKDKPLKKILDKIYKTTGYEITIAPEWKNFPVTVKLKQMSIEEGLRKIIKSLSDPDYALVIDEKTQKITVFICSSINVNQKKVNVHDQHASSKETKFTNLHQEMVNIDDLEDLAPMSSKKRVINEEEFEIPWELLQTANALEDMECSQSKGSSNKEIYGSQMEASTALLRELAALNDMEDLKPESTENSKFSERKTEVLSTLFQEAAGLEDLEN